MVYLQETERARFARSGLFVCPKGGTVITGLVAVRPQPIEIRRQLYDTASAADLQAQPDVLRGFVDDASNSREDRAQALCLYAYSPLVSISDLLTLESHDRQRAAQEVRLYVQASESDIWRGEVATAGCLAIVDPPQGRDLTGKELDAEIGKRIAKSLLANRVMDNLLTVDHALAVEKADIAGRALPPEKIRPPRKPREAPMSLLMATSVVKRRLECARDILTDDEWNAVTKRLAGIGLKAAEKRARGLNMADAERKRCQRARAKYEALRATRSDLPAWDKLFERERTTQRRRPATGVTKSNP